MSNKWSADKTFEWTYQRSEGDIVVFAETAEDALKTIQIHGFKLFDIKKLKLTGGTLNQYLKKEAIK